MTDQAKLDIEAELKVCEGATPGPWLHRPEKHDDWGLVRAADELPVVNAAVSSRILDGWASDAKTFPIPEPPEIRANAEFICHARSGYPQALLELRELRAKVAEQAAAYGPCFFNPLDVWAAEKVRDEILKVSCRLNPDGSPIGTKP